MGLRGDRMGESAVGVVVVNLVGLVLVLAFALTLAFVWLLVVVGELCEPRKEFLIQKLV